MTTVFLLLALLPPAWVATVFLWPPFPAMFGRQAWLPGLLCILWCVGLLAIPFWLPGLLTWFVVVSVMLGLFLSRGRIAAWFALSPLPPGNLSFRSGVRSLANRAFYLQSFQALGPIFKTTQFGSPIICIEGMERICRLMREHSKDLGPSPLAFTQSIMGNFLRYMDDDTHAKYGGLFRRAMAGKAPASNRNHIHQRCQIMLNSLAEVGPVSPALALRRFVRESLDYLLFGFTQEDSRSCRFGELADTLYHASLGQTLIRTDRKLLTEMESLLMEQLKASNNMNQSVLVNLHALDSAMPDRVCLDNLIFMHKIATNNVSSLLGWLLYYWGAETTVVAQIRDLLPGASEHALDAFLCETLRLSQSEYLYRKVKQDFEFEGFYFPRGWMVRSCIWESHRTETALEDPAEFRLRLGKDDYNRKHFSPFGMGRHACNGVDLNRTICLVFLEKLAMGFDVLNENAEPFQRLMRHWSHWQPNHSMKVQLKVRL